MTVTEKHSQTVREEGTHKGLPWWQSQSSKILFLSGVTFIIGFRRTAHFFFQRQKFRGSFFFLGGVSLVLCRWPIIGILVESYGFVLLFRSFFPMALGFVLSAVNSPFLSAVCFVLSAVDFKKIFHLICHMMYVSYLTAGI
uniref:Golgi transport 1A n=1 Tax=Dicentrarchus labrax TaxID=13489 RepID=A0A8P4KQM4_DICLA